MFRLYLAYISLISPLHLPYISPQVVLATNIAETSITIDDAVFVIDSGRAKQSMFDERKQMRRLVDVWISQAEM